MAIFLFSSQRRDKKQEVLVTNERRSSVAKHYAYLKVDSYQHGANFCRIRDHEQQLLLPSVPDLLFLMQRTSKIKPYSLLDGI
jgi:hypothetical protein